MTSADGLARPHSLRLLRAELGRARSRLLVRWIAVALLALAAVLVAESYSLTAPPSASERAQLDAVYAGDLAWWEANHEARYAECLEAEDAMRAAEPELDLSCASFLEPPVREVWTASVDLSELVSAHLNRLALVVAAGTFLVGASLVGADGSTGGLALLLTVEPRRTRVLAAKLASTALTSLALAAAALGALVCAEVAVAVAHGTFDTSAELWEAVGSVAARGAALAVASGVVAASLGAALRSTTGVLGVLLGYLVGVEAVVWGMFPSLQPWVVRPHVAALVDGGAEVSWDKCGASPVDGSRRCVQVVYDISTSAGATYVIGMAVVVVLAVWLVFRRRDVS